MSLRAAGIESFGEAVTILELPDPPPLRADEVLIEVMAAGAANWEEFVRTGSWDVGLTPPMALGVEAAGEVVEVGPEVDWPAPGDAVMTHPLPLPYQGCWAERLVAPARLVAEKPGSASWAEAGAFPVPALTANQVVSEALDVRPGETILVNGASGVTGGMIVQLAAARGVTVLATASSASTARVKELGADLVLDYHDPDWTSRARDAAGSAGITAAANAAPGGEGDVLGALADGGRLATITGAPPPEERGVSVVDVYVRPDGDMLRRLGASLAAGEVNIAVRASYPLAEAAEALEQASRGGGGAIVLEP
jgi:NADPH:quinone reductase-like Zn-dependent oxidoreductase